MHQIEIAKMRNSQKYKYSVDVFIIIFKDYTKAYTFVQDKNVKFFLTLVYNKQIIMTNLSIKINV